jgi:hypothetical protein
VRAVIEEEQGLHLIRVFEEGGRCVDVFVVDTVDLIKRDRTVEDGASPSQRQKALREAARSAKQGRETNEKRVQG